MTDFHTHILPGIDDGSQDLDMTRDMLAEELRQGVDRIVATPHFYAHRDSFDAFLKNRNASLGSVLQGIEGASIVTSAVGKAPAGQLPALMVGAEVYYFPGVGKAERLPELCVRGWDRMTNVILIEMPFTQWKQPMLNDLRTIIRERKLRVVLAHVERYTEFQKDRSVWDQVMALPLTIQINAGSFLKGWKKPKAVLRMLEEHGNVIIGSDCHNMTTRVPNVAEARAVIEKKCGADRLRRLDLVAEELLE